MSRAGPRVPGRSGTLRPGAGTVAPPTADRPARRGGAGGICLSTEPGQTIAGFPGMRPSIAENHDDRNAGPTSGPQAVPHLVSRLRELAGKKREVTVGDIVDAFGAQGHAPLLMVVAFLMILPVGMIPGVGGALGLLTAAIGIQMIAGRKGVWLPGFMRRRGVSAGRIDTIARTVHPVSRTLSRFLHERLHWLASGRASLAVIAVILIVAGTSLVVLGTIPVAVPLVGIPIAVFAVGILAGDGVVVAAGYVLLAGLAAGLAATMGGNGGAP